MTRPLWILVGFVAALLLYLGLRWLGRWLKADDFKDEDDK